MVPQAACRLPTPPRQPRRASCDDECADDEPLDDVQHARVAGVLLHRTAGLQAEWGRAGLSDEESLAAGRQQRLGSRQVCVTCPAVCLPTVEERAARPKEDEPVQTLALRELLLTTTQASTVLFVNWTCSSMRAAGQVQFGRFMPVQPHRQ